MNCQVIFDCGFAIAASIIAISMSLYVLYAVRKIISGEEID